MVAKLPTDKIFCLSHRVLGVRGDHPYCHTKKLPTMRQLEHWVYDSVCKTPDGCRTEPDGGCPHGFKSWLIILGYI